MRRERWDIVLGGVLLFVAGSGLGVGVMLKYTNPMPLYVSSGTCLVMAFRCLRQAFRRAQC